VQSGTGENSTSKQSNGKDGSTEEKNQFVEVRVRESDRLGEGQVWIGETLREELGLIGKDGGDGSFELLRSVRSPPSFTERCS
jgi:hypothetical protein